MIFADASVTLIILICTLCSLFKRVNPPEILEYNPTENDSYSINVPVEQKLACVRSYTTSNKQNDFRVFEEV